MRRRPSAKAARVSTARSHITPRPSLSRVIRILLDVYNIKSASTSCEAYLGRPYRLGIPGVALRFRLGHLLWASRTSAYTNLKVRSQARQTATPGPKAAVNT